MTPSRDDALEGFLADPARWPAAAAIGTRRLILDPLRVEHADEAAALLDDVRLHEFTGGAPLAPAQLRERYARLLDGSSPPAGEGWLNWTVRRRDTRAMLGTAQATLRASDVAATAHIAWTTASIHQRQGYASEAAAAVMAWLRERGIRRFAASIHPSHAASMAVARHVGLSPTEVTNDGETVWVGE